MSRASYSLNNNDSKKFKRLKEVILREKYLTEGIDIDNNDVVIELPNETHHQLHHQTAEDKQLLNYFPTNPNKHIDFVIYYKETTETQNSREIKKFRSKFFKKLKQEDFDLCYIKQRDTESLTYVYVLLCCSLDRLMDEAERMQLELPLKPVS
jgi:hypothetical protein